MPRYMFLGSRLAAVAVCVASSAVLAAPVRAEPRASDMHVAYLLALEHFGLHLSRGDAFAQGVAVCLVLDQPEETVTDVVAQAMGMHPAWNRIDTQHFVGAAEERYCPGKLPVGGHFSVCSADETSDASFAATKRDSARPIEAITQGTI